MQAIAQLMDQKLGQQKQELQGEIQASEQRMTERMDQQKQELQGEIRDSESRIMALMEAYFEPKFGLLLEKLNLLEEKMIPPRPWRKRRIVWMF